MEDPEAGSPLKAVDESQREGGNAGESENTSLLRDESKVSAFHLRDILLANKQVYKILGTKKEYKSFRKQLTRASENSQMIAPELATLSESNLYTAKCLKSLDSFVPKRNRKKAKKANKESDSEADN